MIITLVYGLCFAILLMSTDKGIRGMAGFCLVYLISENLVYWYFKTHPWYFDITIYLTICWALDSALLFVVGCTLKGIRQKLMAAIALPMMLVQVFAIQYPMLFPDYIFVFAVQSGHMYFIEAFIFCASFRDNTVSEWIKTSTILFLVVVAHMVS